MASSASTLLKIEKQADGENDNAWGSKLNQAFDVIEEAIAGEVTISTDADVTLSDTQYVSNQARKMVINGTATLTANRVINVPARTKLYLVRNNTSGAHTLTVKTSAGTGIAVTQGEKAILYCDGTNVIKIIATDDFGSLNNVVEDTTPQLGGTLDANSKQIRWSKGADVASATALTLGTDGNVFDITGTTTITSIGTLAAGTVVILQFDAALTLTHHATDLILPGGANITTAAGDRAIFQEYATGDWRCVSYMRASAMPMLQGKHTIWVPAAAMRPASTNGCAGIATVETTAGRPDLNVLDFDATTEESAMFSIRMPKNWNESTVTFAAYWTSTATDTDGVTWGLRGVAASDGDTIDVAFGTGVTVDDANQSTAEDLYVTTESGAVTIGGTPAAGDLLFFEVYRDVAAGNDVATEDARLVGVAIFYTTNAGNDA